MRKILAVATHSTDDQTRCSLAFVTAMGAVMAEKEAAIALLGDAVYVLKEEVAASIHGVGFPPLTEVIGRIREGNVPVYV